MRAILTAVDYADLLMITLPYNRHHFDDVIVVMSKRQVDDETEEIAKASNCQVLRTDAFYSEGAVFNKFAALEEGLDQLGRVGWLCIMDADIMFPKHLPDINWEVGYLYTPERRIFEDVTAPIPKEPYWASFKLTKKNEEFAGYTQIFSAEDERLKTTPWHPLNLKTAGDGDSIFNHKWGKEYQRRPGFEVLHLGPTCMNWCGRATRYTDGSRHPEADSRQVKLIKHYPNIEKWQKNFNHW